MDADRDPPTQPGRATVPTTNRKMWMQALALVAVLLVLLAALLHDIYAGEPDGSATPLLTPDAIMVALGVLGLGASGAQAGNVGEHFAKALPGIAEGVARAVRGTR